MAAAWIAHKRSEGDAWGHFRDQEACRDRLEEEGHQQRGGGPFHLHEDGAKGERCVELKAACQDDIEQSRTVLS